MISRPTFFYKSIQCQTKTTTLAKPVGCEMKDRKTLSFYYIKVPPSSCIILFDEAFMKLCRD